MSDGVDFSQILSLECNIQRYKISVYDVHTEEYLQEINLIILSNCQYLLNLEQTKLLAQLLRGKSLLVVGRSAVPLKRGCPVL